MNIVNKKKDYKSYSIRVENLNLLLALVFCFSLGALIYDIIAFDINVIKVISIVVLLLFSAGSLAYMYFHENRYAKWFSVVTVLLMNFLMVPIFILYGERTSNVMPLFVILSYICMFFVLDFGEFWWLYLIIGYVNIFSFVRIYKLDAETSGMKSGFAFFRGFAIAFFVMCFVLSLLIQLQEKNLKKAKVEIDRSREIEKNAGISKARFLASMSHEIRTPMNSIIGLSELVLKDEMSDAARNQITVITKSAYNLLEVIDDVLMYSKLDSGKMSLQYEDFHFNELFKQVLDSISYATIQKNLNVRVKLDHNIPKVINGDPLRIKQVFLRLIFVSLSLTDNGRLMISVKCDKSDKENTVRFTCSVSDTGCGLSDYDLQSIYGAFDTYDPKASSEIKGIGLKFNICRELLDMMNGSLQVSSLDGVGLESVFSFECKITDPEPMIRVDGGNRKRVLIYVMDDREMDSWKTIMDGFKIRPDYVNTYFAFERSLQNTRYDFIFVPNEVYSSVSNIISGYRCEEDTYVVATIKQSYGDFNKCRIIRHPVSCMSIVDVLNNNWKPDDYVIKQDSITYDGSKARILVVDDNSVNLKVAQGIFSTYKISIDQAKSGEEALSKMQKMEYHMIFLDMVMPEMSGEDVLKKMRASGNLFMENVPVVALTATTGGNVREEILDKGFQEYLAKPIKQRYLTQCLLTFLPPGILKQYSNDRTDTRNATAEMVKKEAKVNQAELKNRVNEFKPEEGLSRVEGNEEAYYHVLNTYIREGLKNLEEVPALFKARDMDSFTTLVHAIKSSSANVGAITVSEMFKELEYAGRGKNLSFINSHMNTYLDSYKGILGEIKDYLINKGQIVS